jgi:diacylglycerol kinase family enzyme
MSGTPVPVIINCAAGSGHGTQQCSQLEALFRDAGMQARIVSPREGEQLTEVAEREARAKPPLIVAGGGDGTISAVASVLAGSGIALGVLPLGTLNHFARDMGVSLDIAQAVRDIAAGRTLEVDVGEVNGRVFLNNSSMGFYPSMVRHRDKRRRQLGGGKWYAMLWAAMKVLRRHPFLDVNLDLDGKKVATCTPFVFVGNNEYTMQGLQIGKRERLDGGLLSVYLTRRRSRFSLIRLAFRALFGRLAQDRDFEMARVASAEIRPHRRRHPKRRRVLVSTDGEVSVMESPIAYRTRPKALRVIVPGPGAAPS